MLKQLKFGGANIYVELAKLYQKNQQHAEAENTLKQGLVLFPEESLNFYSELINHFLQQNKINDVLTYTDQALKAHPDNPSLYFIKASIIEQKRKRKKKPKNGI